MFLILPPSTSPTARKLRENQFCSGTYTRDGIYVYNGAQHGFGRDERASYSKPDYELAQQQRTLDLFAKHLG